MVASAGSMLQRGGALRMQQKGRALDGAHRATAPLQPLRAGNQRRERLTVRRLRASTDTEQQAAAQSADRGASGLDIEGNRPTSKRAWEIITEKLRPQLKFITPLQLEAAAAAGRPVVDVRPPGEFEKGFIEGSVNVPLYQPITGWDGRKIARRIGFALFGVLNGTEVNPNFMEQLREAAPDTQEGVIFVCSLGGTLEASTDFKLGQQSRSIFAAYEAVSVGYKNVQVLTGGFNAWAREGRDVMELVEDAE